MKNFILSLFLVLLTSCNAIRVSYDYDDKVDYTSFTTYNYYKDMDTGLSDLDERRFLDAMDAVLGEKGFMFSEEAEITINIKSAVFRSQPANNVGVGLGGGGRNVGGGVSIGIPVGGPKMSRELQIDLIDADKDVLIWQAVSNSPFREGDTPMEKEEKILKTVTKIFSKYPPN